MNILAVGAHPDDIEYGCGGTLMKYARSGHSVYLMVVTHGSMGGDGGVRSREQERSAELLGATGLIWGGYEDTQIPVNKQVITDIENVIGEVNPTFIFVHAPSDTHQDHRNVNQATISATRYTKNVLFYEGPTTSEFMPAVFVGIREVMADKLTLLEAHASQIGKTHIEGVSALSGAKSNAVFRGMQARVEYAEGFLPYRLMMDI